MDIHQGKNPKINHQAQYAEFDDDVSLAVRKAKKPRLNQDAAWFEYLNLDLQGFLEFAFPETAQAIDWSQGIKFEPTKRTLPGKGEPSNKREADFFAVVTLKKGKIISLHLEQQSKRDDNFESRVMLYHARQFSLRGRDVTTLVVLTDLDKDWRPDTYVNTFAGGDGSLIIKFPFFKLWDYKDKKDLLRQTDTLAAKVVLFSLEVLENERKRKGLIGRANLRWQLIESVCQKGKDQTMVSGAIDFLKIMCPLTPELEAQQYKALQQLEKENEMNFTQYAKNEGRNEGLKEGIEQGIEKGIEQGIEKGERKMLFKLLTEKFLTIPEEYKTVVEKAPENKIMEWFRKAIFAQTLREVFA